MSKGLEALSKFWPILLSAVAVIVFAVRGESKFDLLVARVDAAVSRAVEDRGTIERRLDENDDRHKEADRKIALLSDIAKSSQTLLQFVLPDHAQKIKGLEDRVHSLELRPGPASVPAGR